VNLILSGRGVDLDEPLRRYVTEKLTRVERFFDRIIKMEVELTEERTRHGVEHRVEVIARTTRESLRAHGEGPDHFAAIDKVTDRLETQLKRVKDRLTSRHRDAKVSLENDGLVPVAEFGASDEDDEQEIVRVPARVTKPLTPDEARFELESRGLNFLLFTNAETMSPAVIYRRETGFGLIEPEG
jgi:putative sigma-54 modulation protein